MIERATLYNANLELRYQLLTVHLKPSLVVEALRNYFFCILLIIIITRHSYEADTGVSKCLIVTSSATFNSVHFRSIFLIFIAYRPVNCTVRNHTCFPSSFTNMCILGHVFYNRTFDTKHIFPQNKTHIRIGNDGWSKAIDSVIRAFDVTLYAELGHPQALEILDSEMETLEIPRALRHGNFADNRLETFWIEEGVGAEPILSFLDLGRNRISNLTNITVFINLETLYLESNILVTVELNTFRKLTKLKFLNLNYNQISKLSGDHFPPSLIYLGLYFNEFKTLNYSALQLPSLEVLNIQRNQLTTIDAARLLLGLPKIKMIRLGHNEFPNEVVLSALEVLKQHNVSYRDEGEEVSCYYGAEEIEGVCMNIQYLGQSWFKAIVLSALTVIIAIVFILLVRWVFIAMNK